MSYQIDWNLNMARDFLLEEIETIISGSGKLTLEQT
jgi:hypothetical protein